MKKVTLIFAICIAFSLGQDQVCSHGPGKLYKAIDLIIRAVEGNELDTLQLKDEMDSLSYSTLLSALITTGGEPPNPLYVYELPHPEDLAANLGPFLRNGFDRDQLHLIPKLPNYDLLKRAVPSLPGPPPKPAPPGVGYVRSSAKPREREPQFRSNDCTMMTWRQRQRCGLNNERRREQFNRRLERYRENKRQQEQREHEERLERDLKFIARLREESNRRLRNRQQARRNYSGSY